MFSARVTPARRRFATRAALRALATFVAALVGLSSLGQFAHFLLVPHAICAEHGELLELSGGHPVEGHAVHTDESSPSSPGVTVLDTPSGQHDHCEVLARGQREQAEPTPATVSVLPAVQARPAGELATTSRVLEAAAPLSLAPKTSPPRARVG